MLRGPCTERVLACFDRISSSGRPDLWVELVDRHVALNAAARVDRRVGSGHRLPLAGSVVAVQDNIDVAGLPTTAGCKSMARLPDRSAPAVAALTDAGAVVVGKTALDQLATGLLGTWSSGGAIYNAFDPRYVAGGACSGGAVAVALGLVDVAVTTDTDGGARVPAACNGLVAIKPTRGLISMGGIMSASPSLDTVATVSRQVGDGWQAVSLMTAPDPADMYQRRSPSVVLAARPRIRIGIPDLSRLSLRKDLTHLYEEAVARLATLCAAVEVVDVSPLLVAGEAVSASLASERYASVGPIIEGCEADLHEEVVRLVQAGAGTPGHQMFAEKDRMGSLRVAMSQTFARVDVIVLPTVPFTPTIAEALDDPAGVNVTMGTFTTGATALDLCAASVPAGISGDGLPFGITIYGAPFHDPQVADLAAAYLTEDPRPGLTPDAPCRLVMVASDPNSEIFRRGLGSSGGRLIEQTTTSPMYRELSMDRAPSKALMPVQQEGHMIDVEVWALPDNGFAEVVATLRPPLGIGGVKLSDGRWLPGLIGLTR
jgi:allophanate hydrolase